MALVVPDAGELELLNKMLKAALSSDEDYILRLFKSDITLGSSTVAADLNAIEADFTDYEEKTLTRAGWGAAATSSGKAQSVYSAEQSWTCGASGNTIFGYYILGDISGVLLWAEKFSSTRILVDETVLNLTPVFTLSSE